MQAASSTTTAATAIDLLLDEVIQLAPPGVSWQNELVLYQTQLHEIAFNLLDFLTDSEVEWAAATTGQVDDADAWSDAETEVGGFA